MAERRVDGTAFKPLTSVCWGFPYLNFLICSMGSAMSMAGAWWGTHAIITETFWRFSAPGILVERGHTQSSLIFNPDVSIFVTKYQGGNWGSLRVTTLSKVTALCRKTKLRFRSRFLFLDAVSLAHHFLRLWNIVEIVDRISSIYFGQ